LNTYDDPDDIESKLILEGPEISTGPNWDAHIVFTGTGVVKWGEFEIIVSNDGISIDGVFVESESDPSLYRNVAISRDGAILLDQWIPFE
jgi:hypothetical protein